MKILVAPLNWGLGHASRCVPLIRRLTDEGNEVILGGDGASMTLLRRHFPKLRYTYLAPLDVRYSAGKSQVWAILRALPGLIAWSMKDHAMLQALLREEKIDRVISDNRFGLYSKETECIYMTHQLSIRLPRPWRWLEPLVARLHARVYTRYNKVWIPDYEDRDSSLAGELSHPEQSFVHRPSSLCPWIYIGPQSRFGISAYQPIDLSTPYDVVAVLSGPEPQRTILEKEIAARYSGKDERVLVVQGLMNRPNTRIKRGNMTIVPTITDSELAATLLGAKRIIVRSGYSTIMDLEALGLLPSPAAQESSPIIEFIPTPGQPEQEYLAFWVQKRTSK